MSVIDLLFTIEDEFQVTIPRDQVELKSLADVVAYIDRLVAEQHALPGPPPPPP
jgi:acyl carrier protein